MSKLSYKDIWRKMIIMNGQDCQEDKCIEEMAEFTQAILKFRRGDISPAEAFKNLVMECAHAKQTIEQVILIYNCEEEVNHEIDMVMTELEYKTKDVELYKLKGRE